jgi:HPt (histidine-containing phosphotransfer) domain-containing protein
MDRKSVATAPPEKTAALLAALWTRNQPVVEARLATLQRASLTNPLPDELRLEAHGIAHMLAGSLGMYGFPEGTLVARELEQMLESGAVAPDKIAALTHRLREVLFPSIQAMGA